MQVQVNAAQQPILPVQQLQLLQAFCPRLPCLHVLRGSQRHDLSMQQHAPEDHDLERAGVLLSLLHCAGAAPEAAAGHLTALTTPARTLDGQVPLA